MVAVTSTVPGNSAGPYSSPLDKLLLHTTEGGTVAGAVAAYRANNSWPHLTVDARRDRLKQVVRHLDWRIVAARSLRNLAGGTQTNTDGVVQIELVGYATRPQDIDWTWLGRNVVGPLCAELDISVQSSVTWLPYPASYGATAVRLKFLEWAGYRGILGHQHAPENDHGDPGAIPIGVLLEASRQTPPPVLPIPSRGDGDVIYELVKADGFTMMVLLSGGKQVRLNGETNKAAYKASDAYIGPVDEVSYGRLVTAYGTPHGA